MMRTKNFNQADGCWPAIIQSKTFKATIKAISCLKQLEIWPTNTLFSTRWRGAAQFSWLLCSFQKRPLYANFHNTKLFANVTRKLFLWSTCKMQHLNSIITNKTVTVYLFWTRTPSISLHLIPTVKCGLCSLTLLCHFAALNSGLCEDCRRKEFSCQMVKILKSVFCRKN